jgi:hypothetical protein
MGCHKPKKHTFPSGPCSIINLLGACRLGTARSHLVQAIRQSGNMVVLGVDALLKSRGGYSFGPLRQGHHCCPQYARTDGGFWRREAIEALCGYCCKSGRNPKKLDVSLALHLHHMDAMLTDFQAVA